MATTIVEDRFAEINLKLDLIVQELDHLKQVRNVSEDLLADLMLVAKDAYKEATGVCSTIELRP